MTDIARLAFEIDSTPLAKAQEEMDKLTQAAKDVENAFKSLKDISSSAFKGVEKSVASAEKYLQRVAITELSHQQRMELAVKQAQLKRELQEQAHQDKLVEIAAAGAQRRAKANKEEAGGDGGIGSGILKGLSGLPGGNLLAAGAAGGVAGAAAAITSDVVGKIKDAAMAMGELVKESTLLAARSETLTVSMRIAAGNFGYSAAEADSYAKSVQGLGITINESKQTITSLSAAHINLAYSTRLARAAQDLAVVGNLNSSETLNRLTHAIRTGNTAMLHRLGISTTFMAGYKDMANVLGKRVRELTDEEKVQSRVNQVIKEASRYNGLYTESMTTAGKQLKSLERLVENFKTQLGEAFLGAFSNALAAVMAGLEKSLQIVGTLNPDIQIFSESLGGLVREALQFDGSMVKIQEVVNIVRLGVGYLTQGIQTLRLAMAGAYDAGKGFISLLQGIQGYSPVMLLIGKLGGRNFSKENFDKGLGDLADGKGKAAEVVASIKAEQEAMQAKSKALQDLIPLQERLEKAQNKQRDAQIAADQARVSHSKVERARYEELKAVAKAAQSELDAATKAEMDYRRRHQVELGIVHLNRNKYTAEKEDISEGKPKKDAARDKALNLVERIKEREEALRREIALDEKSEVAKLRVDVANAKLSASEKALANTHIDAIDALLKQQQAQKDYEKLEKNSLDMIQRIEDGNMDQAKSFIESNLAKKDSEYTTSKLLGFERLLFQVTADGVPLYRKLGYSIDEARQALQLYKEANDPVIIGQKKMNDEMDRAVKLIQESDKTGEGRLFELQSIRGRLTRSQYTDAWLDIMKDTETWVGYTVTLGEGLATTLGDAFAEMATKGERSFKEMMSSWAKEASRMMANKAMMAIFKLAFGLILGDGTGKWGDGTSSDWNTGGQDDWTSIGSGGSGSFQTAKGSAPIEYSAASAGPSVGVVVNISQGAGGGMDVNSSVTAGKGREFGNLLQAAVKTTILQEMRPGGMLYGGR